jgi:quinol monooxygenase YgiN
MVVATVVVGESNIEELVAAFERAVPAFHREDGCERYAVMRGCDRIVTVERWSTMEAMRAHGEAEVGRELVEVAGRLITEPFDVQVLTATKFGDPAKNTI